MDNIIDIVKSLSDEKLLEEISLGEDAFKEGVFEIYQAELDSRGIEPSAELLAEITEDRVRIRLAADEKKYRFLTYLLIFTFFGLFAFIPSKKLLEKDNSGEYIYSRRTVAYVGQFISILSWFITGFGIYSNLIN